MRGRHAIAASLACALLLDGRFAIAQEAGVAEAQPTNPVPSQDLARAEELKKRGDRAMEQLDFVEALVDYSESAKLSPDIVHAYDRGRALVKVVDFACALGEIERFASHASPELIARVPRLDALLGRLRARVTTLHVTCNVSDVELSLDDKEIGKCPLARRVNAGAATLTASAEGYYPVRRALELAGNGITTTDMHLESKESAGILGVGSPVTGARVIIDGVPIGTVPVETALPGGVHAVSLQHEGFVDLDTKVVVTTGGRKDVFIPLEPVPPVTSKWWFWASIGAVAIAGGVVTGALLTTKPVEKGTISPGAIASPLVRF
jgi:hypothetical protein